MKAFSWLLPLLQSVSTLAASIAFEPSSLRVDGLTSPLGVSSSNPTFTWRFKSLVRGGVQSQYQLRASSSSHFTTIVWDSGIIQSNISRTAWGGSNIPSRSRVYWQVNAWDEHNVEVGWSETAKMEVALLDSSDWTGAKWITNSLFKTGTNALPYFVNEFNVDCGQVVDARLYGVGLGLGTFTINGGAVGKEVLAPGYNTYNKTTYYSVYDITSLLVNGQNAIGIALGKGEYDAEKPLDGRYKKLISPTRQLKAIAQLEYTCSDGSTHALGTNEDWLTTVDGPLLESSWYGGEEYDARRELIGWDKPGFDRTNWTKADLSSAPSEGTKLVARRHPPLEIVDEWRAKGVNDSGNGTWVVDFGINYAGWFTISLPGTPNTSITLKPAEILLSDSSITQRTTGTPIFNRYTFRSSEIETYTPSFLYHGMRYLEVAGLPTGVTLKPEDATAHVIRASNEAVGTFETDHELLNGIHRITDRSVQGNMYSVMTDCPDREKLGWIEQNHLVYPAIERFYDIEAYGESLALQMSDAQTDAGLVTSTSPEYTVFSGGYRDDVNWGSAFLLVPLYHYRSYGTSAVLNRYYDSMVRYMDYLASKATNFIINGGLGDWGEVASAGSTPKNLTATWGYKRSADAMITIAKELGKDDDAGKWSDLSNSIASVFQETFWNATTNNTYGTGTQGADAMALSLGVVPEESKQAVVDHLVSSIRTQNNHTTVGEIALPSLFNVLSENGRSDVVFDILTRTDYPSYGYILSFGATSLSEYWDGANGSSSQNHFMLGAAEEWLTSHLAGVRQKSWSTGYRFIDIAPTFVVGVNRVTSTYRSAQGTIQSSWQRSGNAVTLNVTVPVGSIADIKIPLTSPTALTTMDDGQDIQIQAGIFRVEKQPEGYAVTVTVGSGSYIFKVVNQES